MFNKQTKYWKKHYGLIVENEDEFKRIAPHSKKLVEIMAKRRAEKKEASNKQQKDNIKQAVVEIVTKPIEHVKAELPNYKPPQKSVYQQYNDFFG